MAPPLSLPPPFGSSTTFLTSRHITCCQDVTCFISSLKSQFPTFGNWLFKEEMKQVTSWQQVICLDVKKVVLDPKGGGSERGGAIYQTFVLKNKNRLGITLFRDNLFQRTGVKTPVETTCLFYSLDDFT